MIQDTGNWFQEWLKRVTTSPFLGPLEDVIQGEIKPWPIGPNMPGVIPINPDGPSSTQPPKESIFGWKEFAIDQGVYLFFAVLVLIGVVGLFLSSNAGKQTIQVVKGTAKAIA